MNYSYSEDSKLLGESLAEFEPGQSFLEIGVGNGGNLIVVKDKFDLVAATDIIDLRDVKVRNNFAELIVADRASCFREETFDVVAFNPPYVPSEDIVDRTVDGGRGGIQVPLSFLESAVSILKKSGKILMLLSSEDAISDLYDFGNQNHLSVRKIREKKIFFETLAIFEVKK